MQLAFIYLVLKFGTQLIWLSSTRIHYIVLNVITREKGNQLVNNGGYLFIPFHAKLFVKPGFDLVFHHSS